MKGLIAGRAFLAMAGLLMASVAWGQEAGPGLVGPPPMGPHRPPMERAFVGHGIEGRWWNNPRMVEKLKLTDDQRKAFDQVLQVHREKLIDLRANLEKAELVMEPLVSSDQPEEGKILAQIDKVAQARAELEKANARYLLALRSKLTPEQWKQLKELRESRPPMRDGEGPGSRRQGPGHAPGKGNNDNYATPPPAPGPQGMLEDDNDPDSAPDAGAPSAGPTR